MNEENYQENRRKLNPFKILNIDLLTEPQDVMKAVSTALKEKKYSARDIVGAQKMLIHPQQRVFSAASFFFPPDSPIPEPDSDIRKIEFDPLEILNSFDRV